MVCDCVLNSFMVLLDIHKAFLHLYWGHTCFLNYKIFHEPFLGSCFNHFAVMCFCPFFNLIKYLNQNLLSMVPFKSDVLVVPRFVPILKRTSLRKTWLKIFKISQTQKVKEMHRTEYLQIYFFFRLMVCYDSIK